MLDLQLDVVEDFAGGATWLHGDRDWRAYGMDGVEREEDYLEENYGDGEENVMLPKNACGDPAVIELSDDVALLIVNSQWFISDWSHYPELNEGCLAQSRKYFRWMLTNAVKGLQFKHCRGGDAPPDDVAGAARRRAQLRELLPGGLLRTGYQLLPLQNRRPPRTSSPRGW